MGTAEVLNLPDENVVPVAPRFKWFQHLKKAMDALVGMTAGSQLTKTMHLAVPRTKEVRAPVPAIVEDESFAKQWMQRYSEDNVALPSFELSHLISMVLSMPVMVPRVSSTMACFAPGKKVFLCSCFAPSFFANSFMAHRSSALIVRTCRFLTGDLTYDACSDAMYCIFIVACLIILLTLLLIVVMIITLRWASRIVFCDHNIGFSYEAG